MHTDTENTATRTTNDEDSIYSYENSNGYSADMEITYIDDDDISQGVIGHLSIGLNTTYVSPEKTDQYWHGSA